MSDSKSDLHFKLDKFGVLVTPLTRKGKEYIGDESYLSLTEGKALYRGVVDQGDHASFQDSMTRDFLTGLAGV